jgi:DNA-binding transcriptional LysR family regulator
MRTIRVVVGDVPADVEDWLAAVSRERLGIQVVGRAHDTVQVLLKVRETGADVVVAMLKKGGEEPGLVSHVLGEYPSAVVLAVAPELKGASIFRLATTRADLSGLKAGQVYSALRRIIDIR